MRSGIILAAGESRRMGKPKLMLKHQQKSLLAHAISTVAGVVDEVIVVVGAYAELYTAEASAWGAQVVENDRWQTGMGSSVKYGVAALSVTSKATAIVLADQPFVSAHHLEHLFAADAELAFSRYPDHKIGVPVVVQRAYYDRALALPDDCGAKALIDAQTRLATVPLSRQSSVDIDTPEDAARWLPS